MKSAFTAFVSVLLLFMAGCFSPEYGAVSFECSLDGECPDGYECRADNRCHQFGSPDSSDAGLVVSDGALPDGAPSDAAVPDGAPPDGAVVVETDCTVASILLPGITAGTLADAANDANYTCGGQIAADTYYTFTISEAQHVTITSGSAADTSVVLLGDDCAAEVACADDNVLGETVDVVDLAAGTYFVAVQGTGAFSIELETDSPKPSNDQCVGAIALADGVMRIGENIVNARNDSAGSCSAAPGGDVVYSFEVVGANQHAAIVVNNAMGFEPRIAVFGGGDCESALEVGCGYNNDGSYEELDLFDLAPGTYYVWVESDSASPVSFDIGVELSAAISAPSNDTCQTAEVLADGVSTTGTTLGADDDYGLSCIGFDAPDSVYEFTLAAARQVLVTLVPTTPASWPVAVSMRTAANCAAGPEFANSCTTSAYQDGPRYLNYSSMSADTYSVVVDGPAGNFGDYSVGYETRAVGDAFWRMNSTDTYAPIVNPTATLYPAGVTDLDEHVFADIPIGFDFDYRGTTHSTVNVNLNGYLTFSVDATGVTSYNNDCPMLAPGADRNNMVAVFWDDHYNGGAASIVTKLEGSAPQRRLTIEWRGFSIVEAAPCANCKVVAIVTHLVRLYENGDIEFAYGPRTSLVGNVDCQTQHTGCSATIGLNNVDATEEDLNSCNSDTIAENDVIYWVHPR